MFKKRIRTIERNAYHEAGHAVIAVILQGSFYWMRICETAGEVLLKPGSRKPKNRGDDRLVFNYLAGTIAERHLYATRKRRWKPNKYDDGFDEREARKITLRLSGDAATVEEEVRKRTRIVTDLITRPVVWSAVVALAEDLLAKRTLYGPDAEQIVMEALGDYLQEIRAELIQFINDERS